MAVPGPAPPAAEPFDTRPHSRWPRRPLLGVAVGFLAGTGAGLGLPVPFAFPLAVAALALGACLGCRRPALASAALFLAVAAAGWSAASFEAHPPGRTGLANLLVRPAEAVTIAGVIVSDPVLETGGPAGPGLAEGGQWVFLLAADGADRAGFPVAAHGRVRCQWPDPMAAPAYGQRWQLHGVLRDQHRLRPGAYAATRLAMTVTGAGQRLLETGRGNPFFAWCFRGRRAAARLLEAGLADQPDKAGLLKALLLGYRSDLPGDLERTFEVTGTLHIFAISGLHVGVFATLIVALLRTLGVPRHRSSLVLAPVLAAYVIATGLRPSAVRAGVMALAFWSAPTFWRKPDAPSALALAALLIVGCCPRDLASPGFILSFSVVAGILALYPVFDRPGRAFLRPDPWRRDAEPAGAGLLRGLAVRTWSLFAVSLACWLVSFPLTARLFSLFSPVAVIGNLAVVPGAFLIVLTGCLSLVAGVFSVTGAEIFNHANAVFIGWLLRGVEGMSRLPWGHRYVEAPAWEWIGAWYLLLAAWRLAGPSRRARLVPVLAAAFALWVVSWVRPADPGWIRVHAADGATVLQVRAGRAPVLVGGGNEWHADRLVEALRRQGVNRLGVVALAGTSDAELRGLERLLMDLPAEAIWLPAGLDPEWAERLRGYDAPLRRLRQGAGGFLDGGAEWEVLALPAPELGGPVLRIARGGEAVIFMAEPHPAIQYALTQAAIEPAATVLVLSDARRPPAVLPEWVRDTGAARVVAARKRRRGRDDDYRRWREDLAPLVRRIDLLNDGETLDLSNPAANAPQAAVPSAPVTSARPVPPSARTPPRFPPGGRRRARRPGAPRRGRAERRSGRPRPRAPGPARSPSPRSPCPAAATPRARGCSVSGTSTR